MGVVASACTIAGLTLEGFETTEIAIDDESLTVLVAETSAQRSQGLMEIDHLPDEIDGMLFLFEAPVSVRFYMSNTPMALDIWWFDDQGELIGSAEMAPCLVEVCVRYGSPEQITSVLETPLNVFDFELGADLSTIDNA